MGLIWKKTNSDMEGWKKAAVVKCSRVRTEIVSLLLSTINEIVDFHKAQYLITNIAFVCGVIPIKYIYQQGKYVHIEGKMSVYRYWATICLSTIVKCSFFTHFLRDYFSDKLKMTDNFGLTRSIMVYGLIFLGFLDYHTLWKSKEIVSTANKTNQFLEQVSSKCMGITLITVLIPFVCSTYLALYTLLFM